MSGERAAAESDALVEALAERQWKRMTRSSVPYSDITEGDRAACRALVTPVLADIRELEIQGGLTQRMEDPWLPLLTDEHDIADLMADPC